VAICSKVKEFDFAQNEIKEKAFDRPHYTLGDKKSLEHGLTLRGSPASE